MSYLTGEQFLKEFLKPDVSMAQDTKEDGFVTLTDKSGKPYVAQFNEGEKERYKETGKKLSQVKKEEKESKKDLSERIAFYTSKYNEINKKSLDKYKKQLAKTETELEKARKDYKKEKEMYETPETRAYSSENSVYEKYKKVSQLEDKLFKLKRFGEPWSESKIELEKAVIQRKADYLLKDPLTSEKEKEKFEKELSEALTHGLELSPDIVEKLDRMDDVITKNKNNPVPAEYRKAAEWNESGYKREKTEKLANPFDVVYEDDKYVYINENENYINQLDNQMYSINSQRNRDFINYRKLRNNNNYNENYVKIPKEFVEIKRSNNPKYKDTIISAVTSIKSIFDEKERKAERDASYYTN